MQEIDKLEMLMGEQNFTNLRPIPWKRVARISNTTKELRAILDSVHLNGLMIQDGDESSLASIGISDSSLSEVNGVVEQAKFLLERSNKSKNNLEAIIGETLGLTEKAQQYSRILQDIVNQFQHYVKYGGSKQDSSQIDVWVQEANAYLEAIKERGTYIEKRYNRGTIEFELVFVLHHFTATIFLSTLLGITILAELLSLFILILLLILDRIIKRENARYR
ncbi:unnamed protein product, partial [Gongylonema pulchrum]|uniref:Uncharacterized protein n=1 Tax=Gongylonema pulchrum TaxID=637853 RepID=A0A183DPX3_9BILA